MHNDTIKDDGKAFILVVEDDINLRTAVTENLEIEGYDVMSTGIGTKANDYITRFTFDLIVLDINLPDANGFNLCKQWRQSGVDAMILMLTAKDQEDDMLNGFKAGTDDYIVKPYPLAVFLSRIEALLRRRQTSQQNASILTIDTIHLADYEIQVTARKIILNSDQSEIPFTKIEFDLLLYLLENKNRALSYDEIIDIVWGKNIIVVQGAIRNTISSIRKKLHHNDNSQNWNIKTIRGIGYRLEME